MPYRLSCELGKSGWATSSLRDMRDKHVHFTEQAKLDGETDEGDATGCLDFEAAWLCLDVCGM